jgi:tRNA threonylcarbamoyl adenosine modification protein (Sua5/YciO/YrdC/YwlC family)
MLIKLYEENPNEREVAKIADILRKGGVIIYPTDTVYGIGCDINNPKAVERVARIKGVKLEKANFSFICSDLSHLSDYTKQVNTTIYKLMKRLTPGPFTFILPASNNVPNLFRSKKKTVGIRIPKSNICQAIVRELGNPIMTTSVKNHDELLEYTTDPELIYEEYCKLVDAVIDGGFGNNQASTVLDCTSGDYEIIRQGIGIVD